MKKNNSDRRQTPHDGSIREQKRTGEDGIFPCTPSEHLQMICDQQIFKRKNTKEELFRAWKLRPDQVGYRGSPSQAKRDLPELMSLVLDILHEDHEGIADGYMRGMGFYFAFLTTMILGAEILSQKEIDDAIRQINTQYGINLNFEWWLAFLNNYEVSPEDFLKLDDHIQEKRGIAAGLEER